MPEIINVEEARAYARKRWPSPVVRRPMEALLDDCPRAEVESVRHGRWEWYEDWGPSTWLEPPDCNAAEWRCSSCKTALADYIETHSTGEKVYMDNSDYKPTLAYCPCCGAKMDLK